MRRVGRCGSDLLVVAATMVGLSACGGGGEQAATVPASDGSREQLIARAAALELATGYTPPPGEALHHQTAGFAKTLCSAVFITGLDADDAAANIGGFISPFEERHWVTDTVVDQERQSVSLTLPDGVTRTARRYRNQGCVALPIGEDSMYFAPSDIERRLPPAATTPWPMGDVLPEIGRAHV